MAPKSSWNEREADAEVEFRLTALAASGAPRTVYSDYRPQYAIRDDYLTSTRHIFVDGESASTDSPTRALVWFSTPDQYPASLWIGRIIDVLEGSRSVGQARILKINNTVLNRDGASLAPDTIVLGAAHELASFMSELSERAWAAAWMKDLEINLWRAIMTGPARIGRYDLTAEDLSRLRSLSEECGGWIAYRDATGETFVPLSSWLDEFARSVSTSPKRT